MEVVQNLMIISVFMRFSDLSTHQFIPDIGPTKERLEIRSCI